jgi:hypothetical protein
MKSILLMSFTAMLLATIIKTQKQLKNKSLILTLLIPLSFSNLFSQERVNKPLPIISTIINSQLTKSTGWTLNPEGQWVSRANRIPAFIENEFKILIDYEKDGLGIDNFISYQIRDIKIQDSTYGILIKKFKDGYYKYETIDEGWTAYNSAEFYVFNKQELKKLDSIKIDSINLVKIDIIYSNSIIWISNETYISDIQKAIAKQIEEKKETPEIEKHLIFHIAPYKSKNKVQYQIYSNFSTYNIIGGIMREHKVKDENGKYSWDLKQIYLTNDLFKYCYFETDLITFNSFLKITK